MSSENIKVIHRKYSGVNVVNKNELPDIHYHEKSKQNRPFLSVNTFDKYF